MTASAVARPLAVVTGAARGLGAAIVAKLFSCGYEVVGFDVVAPDDHRAVEGDAASERVCDVVRCDIADAAGVEEAVAALPRAPVAVVNNAGLVRFGPLLDLAESDFTTVVGVNLVGTFNVARAAARRMRDEGVGGAIVNITSMNGVMPGPNAGAYGATKAAVALLTQQMALEWGPLGIRVNAVAPGLIDAGMSTPIYADPDARSARSGRVPLGRLGTAEDVSDAVAFLLSEQASYITGQELLIDGGVTMSVISGLPRPKSVDGVGPSVTTAARS